MSTHDWLVERILGEYREMPGLRLTLAQACRLWNLDRATCEGVLARLASQHLLHRTPDGSYTALPAASRHLHAAPNRATVWRRPA